LKERKEKVSLISFVRFKYVGSMQQQQQHLLHSSDSRDYQEQFMARARQQQIISRSQGPRIIKYADPHGQHPSDSHGHSRSSSTSSLDVDEMLLRDPTDQEPPASIHQHSIITSISTSVVELIERVILRDLIQLTMATGSSIHLI
jgi:hypothetical protein